MFQILKDFNLLIFKKIREGSTEEHCKNCKCRPWSQFIVMLRCDGRSQLRAGPLNLRIFLAANSTQNYFLIPRMTSFLWHLRQKCCTQHFATKWDNFWYRKWIESSNLSPCSHSLSIFSPFRVSQPGCQAATICVTLIEGIKINVKRHAKILKVCIKRYKSSWSFLPGQYLSVERQHQAFQPFRLSPGESRN